MTKKVVFGVAVILAAVAVAAVVAVLLSGKREDEVTILTKDRNSSHTAQNESITPTLPEPLPQPLPQPLPEQTEPEVFMQTNNSCKSQPHHYNHPIMMFNFLLTLVFLSPWRGGDQGQQ